MINLFQVGDFYEAEGEQADILANIFGFTPTGHKHLVGIPRKHLSLCVKMLNDRGYDVFVDEEVSESERDLFVFKTTNRDNPIETQPVGRINYLSLKGKIIEAEFFTTDEEFSAKLKENEYYGVPMSVLFFNGVEAPLSKKAVSEYEGFLSVDTVKYSFS